MPPITKLKIKLSISNPVLNARLNKDGGLQYSGTKIGSVKPRSMVNALTISISFLVLLKINTTVQITNNINENTNHSLNIVMFFLLPYRIIYFCKEPSSNQG